MKAQTVKNEARGVKAGAWRTWLVVGATGFGGPAGQIAILHREVVERKKWLTEEDFLAAMRVCMLLPGPEAQQLATYAGWRLAGLWGGLVAGTLFVVPGALLVTCLAWLHAAGQSLPLVAAGFTGTRPAVVALVALAAWRIGKKSIRSAAVAAIAVLAAAALALGAGFPWVVGVAAAIGWLMPADLAGATKAGSAAAHTAAGVSLLPPRSLRWSAAVVAVAGGLWLGAYGVVSRFDVAGGAGPAIARLFTETTLLSLGGAYAVVPWALDESVARGWLVPDERFDALAMGEATPGPLILVVTFIGFLAGWKADLAAPAVGGCEGAAVATLFAFLPSFALVLAVAPFVQSVRPGSGLGRAMAAIGGVVVAAIVLLGVRLAIEAFAPTGRLELVPLIVGAVSGGLLISGRASAPLVILAAAAVGCLAARP